VFLLRLGRLVHFLALSLDQFCSYYIPTAAAATVVILTVPNHQVWHREVKGQHRITLEIVQKQRYQQDKVYIGENVYNTDEMLLVLLLVALENHDHDAVVE
jgi:hypothetical protein